MMSYALLLKTYSYSKVFIDLLKKNKIELKILFAINELFFYLHYINNTETKLIVCVF
jgi:hypothetical protein